MNTADPSASPSTTSFDVPAMGYERFAELVTHLHTCQVGDTEYLASMPSQLSEVLVTNPLAESQYRQIELLSGAVFGEHWPDVRWFLFDWKPGFTIEVTLPGEAGRKTFTINELADYLAYVKQEIFRCAYP